MHEKLGIEVERNGINSCQDHRQFDHFSDCSQNSKRLKVEWIFSCFQTQWLHLTLQLPSSDYKVEIGLDRFFDDQSEIWCSSDFL